ncbi:MAG: fimbrial biogenesis outer membrane usher protein [Betaproteobacteria bacterium]|nr:MAG: fimbrial biogenesis outer membrane usher protein [Betaproteobacteria bacterium]
MRFRTNPFQLRPARLVPYSGFVHTTVVATLFTAGWVTTLHAQSAPPARIQIPAIAEQLVSVTLNGTPVSDALEVLDVAGLGVLVSPAAFASLKLVNVTPRTVQRGRDDFVSLSRTPGLRVRLDRSRLELFIDTSTELLGETALMFPRQPPVATTVTPGAYVNYDVTASRTGGQNQLGGQFEAVAFSELGSAVASAVVREPPKLGVPPQVPGNPLQDPRSVTRLDTYVQRDFASSNTRLRIGDSVSVAGRFGPAVRFGGVQFGTEDAIDPRFVTLPTVDFRGSATVPSTVDVFMNSGMQRSFNVPAGNFNVTGIPTTTGTGTARMVVKDILGREVVIEQPFFNLPGQLRTGLSRYSVAAGWLRNNYSLSSNDYGSPFAAALWRYGISDRLTVELRGEAQRNGPRGAGATLLAPLTAKQAVSISGGVSEAAGRRGQAAAASYQYVNTIWNAGAQAEWRNRDYRMIGGGIEINPYTSRLLGNAGLRLGDYGAMTLSYGQTDYVQTGLTRFALASYSLPINREWRVYASYNRRFGNLADYAAYLGVNWNGADGYYGGGSAQASCASPCKDDPRTDGSAYIGRRANGYEGFNWQLEGNRNGGRGFGEYLGTYGIVNAELSRSGGFSGGTSTTTSRVGARGSVVWMDGSAAAGQPVQDAVIMVRAPEGAGMKITGGGGGTTRLDSRGVAVLTRVSAYDGVAVSPDASTAPLDVNIPAEPGRAATRSKSGTVLNLDIRRLSPATFTLIDRRGKVIPAGVLVFFGKQAVKVGLDGLVYLESVGSGGAATGRKNGSRCDFVIPTPPAGELQPFLGALTCELRPV